MNVNIPERKGELKLNQPKPFTGKREDLKKFLQDVRLYLYVNEKVYDNCYDFYFHFYFSHCTYF